MGVMPDAICQTNANELEFKVVFDTQLDFASVFPEDAVIYQSTLFDNIGLFKNQYWTSYPELALSVSQSGFPDRQQQVDLTDAVMFDDGPALPSS